MKVSGKSLNLGWIPHTKGYPMNSNLLCTLTIVFFVGNQISGALGYPSIPSYADADSVDQYFLKNLESSLHSNLNQLKTDLEELTGKRI